MLTGTHDPNIPNTIMFDQIEENYGQIQLLDVVFYYFYSAEYPDGGTLPDHVAIVVGFNNDGVSLIADNSSYGLNPNYNESTGMWEYNKGIRPIIDTKGQTVFVNIAKITW